MTAPLNLPDDPNQRLTMDGFVADYISAFTAEMGKQPNLGAVRPDHEGLHTRADAGSVDAPDLSW